MCNIFLYWVTSGNKINRLFMKIIISPWPVSGLVNPNDQGFSTWCKLVLADFFSAYFQMVLVLLVLTLSVTIELSNPVARIIFFIGALLGAMNAPAGIAQLLGGDIGASAGIQQMMSLNAVGKGLGLAGAGIGAAAGIATTAAASGTYGAGRAMGMGSQLKGAIGGSGASGGSSATQGSGGFSGIGQSPQGESGASSSNQGFSDIGQNNSNQYGNDSSRYNSDNMKHGSFMIKNHQ